MTTLSSHVLNAVTGDHAGGIRVELFALSGTARIRVFEVVTGPDGRVSERFTPPADADGFELVFHSAEYFSARTATAAAGSQILRAVVMRLALADPDGHYHVPLVLSPHAYTVWWSA